MRDFPEGIRSVVLDSTYPLEVDIYAEHAPNAGRTLDLIFDSCQASRFCDDIEGKFGDVMRELDERPVTVSLESGLFAEGFGSPEVLIDDTFFLTAIYQALYTGEGIALVPRMIDAAAEGDLELPARILSNMQGSDTYFSYGLHLSVQCSGEVPFISEPELRRGLRRYPAIGDYFQQDAEFATRACRRWSHAKPDSRDNEPVVSDIPALVLAGRYDPVTPPSWGETAAENLTNSFFFEFPGLSHGVVTSDACPFEITEAFLGDPGNEPEAGCIQNMDDIQFPW
jgi:pimeloyl-ACP methyl ester carboxylesterase